MTTILLRAFVFFSAAMIVLDADVSFLQGQDKAPQPLRIISPFFNQDAAAAASSYIEHERNRRYTAAPHVPSAPILSTPMTAARAYSTSFALDASKLQSSDVAGEAETAFFAGHYDKAARAIEKAIANDRQSLRLAFLATHIYVARQDYVTAAYYLDRAIRILKLQNSSNILGNFKNLYETEDFSRHLAVLDDYAASHRTAFDAKLLLAFYRWHQGKRDDALKLSDDVLAGWPDNSLAIYLRQLFDDSSK
jgi:tetratricopeptide (TPR) repeat protein